MLTHEFAVYNDGSYIENEYSDMHPGLHCTRCYIWTECYLCNPDILDEPCNEQTPYLF